jgi:hypothetical protein
MAYEKSPFCKFNCYQHVDIFKTIVLYFLFTAQDVVYDLEHNIQPTDVINHYSGWPITRHVH